eukprot:TRINITY_DN32118_c0_g1_i1.p1 TRINITY_DN32118_c0_g1~~TRINITY_DN32118_c0_g1_i1.p1  ORF type:complete len:362 (+),score=136.31 TRINITY_DN32118_c0_g1_i1:115-1200(+)
MVRAAAAILCLLVGTSSGRQLAELGPDELGLWLEPLGLAQFADPFRAAQIGGAQLIGDVGAVVADHNVSHVHAAKLKAHVALSGGGCVCNTHQRLPVGVVWSRYPELPLQLVPLALASPRWCMFAWWLTGYELDSVSTLLGAKPWSNKTRPAVYWNQTVRTAADDDAAATGWSVQRLLLHAILSAVAPLLLLAYSFCTIFWETNKVLCALLVISVGVRQVGEVTRIFVGYYDLLDTLTETESAKILENLKSYVVPAADAPMAARCLCAAALLAPWWILPALVRDLLVYGWVAAHLWDLGCRSVAGLVDVLEELSRMETEKRKQEEAEKQKEQEKPGQQEKTERQEKAEKSSGQQQEGSAEG